MTVNAAGADTFEVLTIPHTLERTTLGQLRDQTAVNIEVDLIARYLERLLDRSPDQTGLTLAALAAAGFTGPATE